MASRRFFGGYDPYEYYYAYPTSNYPYYSHHQAAPARPAGAYFPAAADADEYYGYFPATEDVDPYYQPVPARRARGSSRAARNAEPATAWAATRPEAGASRPVTVPVVGSDSEPKVARVPVKRAPSKDEAAVRLHAAARGFLTRRAVRALRAVAREADEIAAKVAREAEALRGDARARVGVGEELMRLLLRLDAVRGAREYRRRVARRVLALQDAVDALEQSPEPAAVDEEAEAGAAEATTSTVEMAEGNAVAADLPGPVEENNGEMEDELTAETAAEMEVDGDTAAAEDAEPAPDGANLGGDKPTDEEDPEGEWEMVAEEPAAAYAQEPAGEDTAARAVETGGGADTKKLMEMVAALCEQSAQQCAVIGVLAERVNALERTVWRMEDAERRRRRAKKLKNEGKGSSHIKCYSD